MKPILRGTATGALLALTLVSSAIATTQDGTGGSSPDESASGGLTLRSSGAAILGRTVTFRGTVSSADSGRPVLVEREDGTGGWVEVARTKVRGDGTFGVRWKTDHIGRFATRAVMQRGIRTAATQGTPDSLVTVYRRAPATWYGPGFYGERTACGQTLTKRLRGVAHRTLPCGTPVALRYRGRSMTVPVVDRGPFSGKAKWDLTGATAQALRFEVSDVIGAVALRER